MATGADGMNEDFPLTGMFAINDLIDDDDVAKKVTRVGLERRLKRLYSYRGTGKDAMVSNLILHTLKKLEELR